MKLEVGMYVRHKPLLSRKYVKINKIKEIEEKENCLHIWLEDKDLITEKYLIKASHNIIDLIEVGDILEINGEKYEVIYDESYEKLGILIPSRKELSIRHSALEYVFKKYEVAIVTKEQFEQTAYKVGDK